MAENSNIGWTNHTNNFWVGCDKVSPGCQNCYMFSGQKRFGADPSVLRRTKPATFNKPLTWHKNTKPGEQLRVFVCSWSDFFHKGADEWRADAWDIIRQTPNITYQILTKRPSLVASRLPDDWGGGWDNVWLGVSAEDQEWFERRWSVLEHIPAKVRFVSYEPALGPLSVREFLAKPGNGHYEIPDWIIVGGESGPGARCFNPAWAETLIVESGELARLDNSRDRMKVFVKQMGESATFSADMDWPEGTESRVITVSTPLIQKVKLKDKKGADMSEFPVSLRVQEYPA